LAGAASNIEPVWASEQLDPPQSDMGISSRCCRRRVEGWALDLGVFLGSQLTEASSRFPAHVQDIRDFLLKEKLPVPSRDAIPQLTSRIVIDPRFRADLASLMRAMLYQEREQIGYEELLGILVAAAAGTEHHLESDSQEADIREMLRFLLQSRRSTFRPDAEEVRASVEPGPREPEKVAPVQEYSEPVLRSRGPKSTTRSMKLELRGTEPQDDVGEADSRKASNVVLPLFRTTGLFASQQEPEASWWRAHSAWIVGVVCILLGLGIGQRFHGVISAAETHITKRAAESFSSKPKTSAPVAQVHSPAIPPQTDGEANAGEVEAVKTGSPAGTAQTASVTHENQATTPAATTDQVRAIAPEASSGVPVTVVKQVVKVSQSVAANSGDATDTAQSTATKTIVRQVAAGMTAANVIFSPAPEYPAAAAAARVHGEVTVHVVVDPDGKVIYAHAVSGPPLLRDAAKEAVERWRYQPVLDNGKPIAVTTVAILDFRFAR
jgi:TonB family protein